VKKQIITEALVGIWAENELILMIHPGNSQLLVQKFENESLNVLLE